MVKKELLNHPLSYTKRDFDIEDLIKLGKTLDGNNIGIGREKDTKYLKLFEDIQNIKVYYTDSQLNEYIENYLNTSYVFK